jgi:exodeoxyribonuclease V alpha subunit
MEKTVESLAGYVEHIIYRNADNGYTVLNLVSGEDEITCVGIFSAIAEGENIEAQGEYTEHPTYGQQFKVTSFEEKAPEGNRAVSWFRCNQGNRACHGGKNCQAF